MTTPTAAVIGDRRRGTGGLFYGSLMVQSANVSLP